MKVLLLLVICALLVAGQINNKMTDKEMQQLIDGYQKSKIENRFGMKIVS